MKTNIRSLGLALALMLVAPLSARADDTKLVAATAGQPIIQVAVLLDTSNSMDGLINQAKSQLWKIVNELARARRGGKTPRLEVALYEYGNDSLAANEGHIRQVVPLTTDLDRISEELFALTTNGGNEFCGHVISRAIDQLQWSADPKALKLVFIAGNEPFDQGKVDYRKAVKKAIERGVAVNTIFCGDEREGIEGKWKDGAMLADGRFSFINSEQHVAHVAAPQDAEIERLGEELNKTYIAYGGKGKEKAERQARQDSNAKVAAQGASVNRSLAKASSHYKNEDWDLVDAKETGAADVAAMPAEALPEEMKDMKPEERTKYVDEMSKKRAKLQKEIAELAEQRRKFVEAEQKKQAEAGATTFDTAVLETLRSQASKKEFTFEE